jgi:hypothetical protein
MSLCLETNRDSWRSGRVAVELERDRRPREGALAAFVELVGGDVGEPHRGADVGVANPGRRPARSPVRARQLVA